ncbi:MAG: hypothetical protein SFV21_03075 [Rhodospirillaceae bacterium]|nr:hypothetical protein [Rhodospirillaceae bacterium]
MVMILLRKLAVLTVAVALIAPPLTGLLSAAVGGDGSHVHFDHVWHSHDFDEFAKHSIDLAGQSHTDDTGNAAHCDHVHLTVMMMISNVEWRLSSVHAVHGPPLNFSQAGRTFSPPSRPPQHFS